MSDDGKKFYETEAFKKIDKKWKAKLKKSGFDDIENDEGQINTKIQTTQKRIDETRVYYSQCRQFLHEHKWANDKDKAIWEDFSEGLSIRDIAKKHKSNYYRIQKTLSKYKALCRV